MQSEWYDANIIEIEQKYLILNREYLRAKKQMDKRFAILSTRKSNNTLNATQFN